MKTISGKKFAKLLEKHGWYLVRVNGSHHNKNYSNLLSRANQNPIVVILLNAFIKYKTRQLL